MRPPRRHLAGRGTPEVDVTAFLSLMVILVPFLMITAVFSRMTILELEAAASADAVNAEPDALQLQVWVREQFIEVRHKGRKGPLRFDRTPDGRENRMLAELAAELKAQFPRSVQATLWLEPQISYDDLVQIMDAVRIRPSGSTGDDKLTELFPQITLAETAASNPVVKAVK
ncbi:MAG: biopolymer transporter ExbD [Sedimenticolaceae bacterium]